MSNLTVTSQYRNIFYSACTPFFKKKKKCIFFFINLLMAKMGQTLQFSISIFVCAVPSGQCFLTFYREVRSCYDLVVMLGCTSIYFVGFKTMWMLQMMLNVSTFCWPRWRHSTWHYWDRVWVYYRETWAPSPLSRGCLYLMETPYLKCFMVFECGT